MPNHKFKEGEIKVLAHCDGYTTPDSIMAWMTGESEYLTVPPISEEYKIPDNYYHTKI